MTADTLKTTRVLELYQDFLSGKLMLIIRREEKNTGRIFIQIRIISQPLSRNRNSGTMKKRKYGKPMILLMENGRKR